MFCSFQAVARRRKFCLCIGGFLSIVIIVGIVLTIVVNRLFLIMPVTSFLGFIVSGVCFYRSFKIQFNLKSTSDGTDIKLKAKGTQEGVSVDFKAKIKE